MNRKIEQKINEAERHQKVNDYSLETLLQAGDQTLTDIRNSFDRNGLGNSQQQLVKFSLDETMD